MNEEKLDRRIQRTRQLICDALMALMLEKSYDKITIQEIIDRANVGRATFYNHYQDKDDLLLRGIAEIVVPNQPEEVAQQTHHHVAPEEQPHTIVTTGMFEHSRQNGRLHQVIFKRNQENPILAKITAFLYTRVEDRLKQLTAEGSLSVPIPIMAQFITGGLLSLIQWWHDNDFPYTSAEMDAFFQQIAMPGTLTVLGKQSKNDNG